MGKIQAARRHDYLRSVSTGICNPLGLRQRLGAKRIMADYNLNIAKRT